MNSPKDYLTDRVKEIIGYNDRGIVEYWEDRQYAKCTNCGAEEKGKKAKDWMFGHVGCPKPNGYFIRNDATPQKIMDVIQQSMEVGRKEVCICAAMKMPDGYIFRVHRHGYKEITQTQKYKGIHADEIEQGFITSKNRFVTREEGRKLQDKAGIPSANPEGYMPGTLFSEDLY